MTAVLILGGFGPALHAQGGPPFITDDPGTPGDGHWEINTAWTYERRPAETSGELPLLDVNYGVGPRVQLKFEMPRLIHGTDGEPRERAVGESLLGVKWRFLEEETNGITASIYPQFGFRTPGSSALRRGLVDGGNTFILPLQIGREIGDWGVNVDFGGEFRSRAEDAWFGGVVVGRGFGEKWVVGAELHAEWDQAVAHAVLVADVGCHVQFAEHHTLLFSVGREIHNHDEPEASLLLYLGWQWTR